MKPVRILLLVTGLSAGISILLAQTPPPSGAEPVPAETLAPTNTEAATPSPAAPAEDVDPILLKLRQKAAADRGEEGSVAPGEEPSEPAAAEPGTTDSAMPEPAPAPAPAPVPSAEPVPEVFSPNASTNGLILNFKDASLDTVLNYLSQAAGFIIVKEARVSGRVNVVSHQPMTKAEAVDLLNSVLYKNGCGAIVNGRVLTIVSQEEMKTRGIPVKLWDGDPESIPRADVVVTMVLPVRFVAVSELMQNIIPLVSPSTPLTANQSGNSIIITDTQANVRRVAELIKAVDSGAEDVTVVKVFPLQYANPQEVADVLSTLFADNSRNNNSGAGQLPIMFGGGQLANLLGGGGGPGGGGRMRAAGGGGGQTRTRARTRVVAVADMRTGSVIVTASRDQMDDIEVTVRELDATKGRNADIAIFPVDNVEPAEALSVLTEIFNKSGGSVNRNSANSALMNRSTSTSSQYGTSSRTGSSQFGTSSRTGSSFGGSSGTSRGGFGG
jgi:general secretion pathway protein D